MLKKISSCVNLNPTAFFRVLATFCCSSTNRANQSEGRIQFDWLARFLLLQPDVARTKKHNTDTFLCMFPVLGNGAQPLHGLLLVLTTLPSFPKLCVMILRTSLIMCWLKSRWKYLDTNEGAFQWNRPHPPHIYICTCTCAGVCAQDLGEFPQYVAILMSTTTLVSLWQLLLVASMHPAPPPPTTWMLGHPVEQSKPHPLSVTIVSELQVSFMEQLPFCTSHCRGVCYPEGTLCNVR